MLLYGIHQATYSPVAAVPLPPQPGWRLRLPCGLHSVTAKRSISFEMLHMESGSDLSSRAVSSQVLSALKGLTAVFGMGTGGTPSSLPPEMVSYSLRRSLSFPDCRIVAPFRFPVKPSAFAPTCFPLQMLLCFPAPWQLHIEWFISDRFPISLFCPSVSRSDQAL